MAKILGKIIKELKRAVKISRFGSFLVVQVPDFLFNNLMIDLGRWYMKLKCANCGEIPDKWQYVDQMEKQPLKGGRGEACAVIKCKVRF